MIILNKLETINLNDNITRIGGYAFEALGGSMVLTLSALPANLIDLNTYAFSCCPNVTFTVLPKTLQTLGQGAFHNASKVNITQIGYPNSDVELSIANGVFARTGQSVTELTLYPFKNSGAQPFKDSYENLIKVINGSSYDSVELIEFGLPSNATYEELKEGV